MQIVIRDIRMAQNAEINAVRNKYGAEIVRNVEYFGTEKGIPDIVEIAENMLRFKMLGVVKASAYLCYIYF